MSIFGIGTDICDVRRIRLAYERHPDRLVMRILSTLEQQIWHDRMDHNPNRALRFLATRFSAKEAFSKAIGLGLRFPMTWQSCEIISTQSGQPIVNCHGALQEWMRARNLRARVSLSDECDHVVSFVIVEEEI